MRSDGDDDALSWEGDDELEGLRSEPRRRESAAAEETAAPSAPSLEHVTDPVSGGALAEDPVTGSGAATATSDEPQALSTVSLVMLGVLGGVYLLYTIGWFLGGTGVHGSAAILLPAPLYQAGLWAAVLAPALWFSASVVATRHAKTWVRMAALVLGALLLVPWPFVVAGGGGVL
ncbi:DNA polymerase III subunit gamma/tau [Microbacterium soli]|uniref:DNA polymerase III subunit gamma/tau n=1 Tax=Microbacterium soli TaxID=446075 RepID=A0ABP7MKT8_9MICO